MQNNYHTYNITDKEGKLLRSYQLTQDDIANWIVAARHCIQLQKSFHRVWEFIRWINPIKQKRELSVSNDYYLELLINEAKRSQFAFNASLKTATT